VRGETAGPTADAVDGRTDALRVAGHTDALRVAGHNPPLVSVPDTSGPRSVDSDRELHPQREVVRDAERDRRPAQAGVRVHVWHEIEVTACAQRQIGQGASAAGEPRDLIVVIVIRWIAGVVEYRSRQIDELAGDSETCRGEGVEQRAALPVDVEVSEAEQVVVEAIAALRLGAEDIRDLLELGQSIGRHVAEENMQRDEDEDRVAALEADRVGGSRKLLAHRSGPAGGGLFARILILLRQVKLSPAHLPACEIFPAARRSAPIPAIPRRRRGGAGFREPFFQGRLATWAYRLPKSRSHGMRCTETPSNTGPQRPRR